MTQTLIIVCHPYDKSFSHSIKEAMETKARAEGKAYQVIDLHADHFNPAYTTEELALFKEGTTTDTLVTKYMDALSSCTDVIAIFPVWWNDVPGMMKGFIDKVMKMNFAYQSEKNGVQGLLTHINSFTAITTSTSPTWYLKFFCGNAIQSVFLNASIKQMGIKKRTWINLGNINNQSDDARKNFLARLDLLPQN